MPGVESDVNNLLQNAETLVGSLTRPPEPPRTTAPAAIPPVPDLTPKPSTGQAQSSPAPQLAPPVKRPAAPTETTHLREGAAAEGKRAESRTPRSARAGTAARQTAPGTKSPGRAHSTPQEAPKTERDARETRAGAGGKVPRPVRAVADAIPDSMKAALAGMSAVLLVLVVVVLYSRRRLAAALRRAHLDVLTGLPNRAAVDDALRRMAGQAVRAKTSLAAVLFDVDYFKSINDLYGHTKGDEVLAAVGAVVRAEVRAGDFVGRYGGEEFLLVLPDTGERGAESVCQKLQDALREIDIEGVTTPITASFGVAAGRSAAQNLTDLVQRADRTMYRAKANGRDRIELETSDSRAPAVA